jgi:DNA-binding transcriptional LysR family regulator
VADRGIETIDSYGAMHHEPNVGRVVTNERRALERDMIEVSQLRKVNLNRLPVLWELLRCRNVSIAATNLGLTQSTVSAALKDLRDLFDDELLVSAGRELVLTDRAQELVPRLRAILELAGNMMFDQPYNPSDDRSAFRIATADYVSTLLLPELAEDLATHAPHAMVQILQPSIKVATDLKLGVVDLIIGPEQMIDWIGARGQEQQYCLETCLVDSLVGICRSGDAQHLTDLHTYLTRPHVAIHIHRELPASLEYDVLISKKMRQDNRFLVPSFALLPMLVENTGLVSVIPKSIARHYVSRYAFEMFDPPVAFPPLTLKLLWARGREKDLRLRWFLERIREAFRRVQARA